MEYNFIQRKFLQYPEEKQITVYAQSLKHEYYELLRELRDCIPNLTSFLVKVEYYLKQNR